MKPWIVESEKGILLKMYVQPGAVREEVAGEFGDPVVRNVYEMGKRRQGCRWSTRG